MHDQAREEKVLRCGGRHLLNMDIAPHSVGIEPLNVLLYNHNFSA